MKQKEPQLQAKLFKNTILRFLILLIVLFGGQHVRSQCNFIGGTPAKFEPPEGKCYVFIGQNNAAINDYTNQVGGPVPSGYTLYTNPRNEGLFSGFYNDNCETNNILAHTLDANYDNTMLSIGYFWAAATYGEHIGDIINNNPNQGFINDVNAFADFCKNDGRPIFLRLGFEFDLQYQGYDAFYVKVWQYIVDRFRAKGVDNVAFIWQASYGNGDWNNYAPFYPGDDYVDWFGYSQWDNGNTGGATMISKAREKGKPVMICESAPKSQSGQWGWYSNLAAHIKANDDIIKGWSYINFDWVGSSLNSGCWSANEGWGDSRIQINQTIETNWKAELADDFYLKGGTTDFINDAKTNFDCVDFFNAKFTTENNIDRVYVGEELLITDKSAGSTAPNSWAWDFGAGSSLSSSLTKGPHNISWSSPGEKTITLTVGNGTDQEVYTTTVLVEMAPTGCVIGDEIDASTMSVVDLAFTEGNAFTHTQVDGVWKTSVDGHSGFDFFTYHFNNNGEAYSYNLSHLQAQPIVTIRARKVPNAVSPGHGGSHPKALLKLDLFDDRDIPTDGLPSDGMNNRIVLTENWETYTIDFSGELINHYSVDGSTGYGVLDERKMLGIRFAVNPFWTESYAIDGYEDFYSGDIEIDYLYLGAGCDGAVAACISPDKLSGSPGDVFTFSNCSTGEIIGYQWDFGAGASMATANSAGPHQVSYSTDGMKIVSLSVTHAGGTETTTMTVIVSNCDAAYLDNFDSRDALNFTGGAGASGAFSYEQHEGALQVICSAGHGDWDYAAIEINNGAGASPVDVSLNPILYIRAKATEEMALRVTLADENDVQAQTTNLQGSTTSYDPQSGSFNFPVSTEWAVYEIDFTDELYDEWTSTGALDEENISHVLLKPNPAWNTDFSIFGYESYFEGTLYIDYLSLGADCGSLVGVDKIEKITNDNSVEVYPSPFQDFAVIRGSESGNGIAVITDAQGRLIEQFKIPKNGLSEVGSEWHSGVYFGVLTTETTRKIFKLIKE